jgi:hypothetical protein
VFGERWCCRAVFSGGDESAVHSDELGNLCEALRRAGNGHGVVMAITGPIASGKTELLESAAAESDFITLRASCA